MTELILTSLAASLWCLGLWTVTEPKMLLSFLKQPLLKEIDNRNKAYIKEKNRLIEKFQRLTVGAADQDKHYFKTETEKDIELLDKEHNRFKSLMKTLNPFILCPVCMGSVHGFVVCFSMHGLTWWAIPVMIMTAGLNKIWHEKLI